MLIAPIALLIGPFQFLPGVRQRFPAFHRRAGRVYVVACLIAGAGGVGHGLPRVRRSRGGLGMWAAGRALGRRNARRLVGRRSANFGLHRLLVRFSFAMTFGAVTLRLQIPIGFVLGYASYSAMSVWLAYTAWIPNVIVVALYTVMEQRRSLAPQRPSRLHGPRPSSPAAMLRDRNV